LFACRKREKERKRKRKRNSKKRILKKWKKNRVWDVGYVVK